LRLSAFAHVASGASLVAYWHWHSLHYGQETYWRGVLGHDLEPNRVYREVSRIGAELKRIGPELVGLVKNNAVSILFSNESHHAIRYMPFSDRIDYMGILRQMYAALFRMNVEVDFVTPQTADLSRYQVLLVPPLYAASDETLERIARFVQNGGHAIVAFKSGFADEHSTVRWHRPPGPLRKAAGFSYQEFSSLVTPVALKPDIYGLSEKNRASVWAEFLQPEGAEILASYDHSFFGKFAALTRNGYGKGTLTYEGTVLTDELQQAAIQDVLGRAKLTGPDQRVPSAIRIRHGRTASGATLHFYLNFSGQPQTPVYAYSEGVELLSGRPVRGNNPLRLGPWDVGIV
jgi:beta-galactosidase